VTHINEFAMGIKLTCIACQYFANLILVENSIKSTPTSLLRNSTAIASILLRLFNKLSFGEITYPFLSQFSWALNPN